MTRQRVAAGLVLALAAVFSGSMSEGASATPAAPQASDLQPVSLGTFEQDLDKWTYNGGWEFKGAKGTMERDASVAFEGSASAKLSGDFTKGGAYVAMTRAFKADAQEIRFRVKAPGLAALDVRLTDGSKQTFQYKVTLKANDAWQEVVLKDFGSAAGHWGGANDGKWHAPMKDMWIMLPNSIAGKKGAIWIDSVVAMARPIHYAPPTAMPADARISPNSIFGFSAHMLHNDLFYGIDKFDPYNRLEYTLPHVVRGHFGIVREGLYQGFFAGEAEAKCAPHRAQVDQYLAMYQKAGVRVVLAPLFSKVEGKGFNRFFEWLGDMAAKYPCVAGIEMGNEPNLRFFWGGTTKDYAEACQAAGKLIKARSPRTPVIVGSISHLWWGPGVKWLEDAFRAGAMDPADGISVHPYRNGSPPEGGSLREKYDDPDGLAKELRDWWALVQKHNPSGKPLKLYFTEVGWYVGTVKAGLSRDNAAAGGVSLECQADYISRLAMLVMDVRLRGIPVEALCWYDLKCDGESPADLQSNFGVISYDATTVRPSYTAYARVAEAFDNPADLEAMDGIVSAAGEHAGVVKTFAWRRRSDGALIIPFWRLNQLQKPGEADFQGELRLKLPGQFTPSGVVLNDLHQPAAVDVKFSAAEGTLTVPVQFTARAAWLVVKPTGAAGLHSADK
jgi:hypothetical protein